MKRSILASAIFLASCHLAAAHEFKLGLIEINHPWSRPTPPAAPVASGYMKLTNTGTEPERLIEIRSPLAGRAEIHRSTVDNGIAQMRPVPDGIALVPGQVVDFETEKLHVMFIDPIRQLNDGDRFPATLVFENAGAVGVEFVVQRKGDDEQGSAHSGHSSQ